MKKADAVELAKLFLSADDLGRKVKRTWEDLDLESRKALEKLAQNLMNPENTEKLIDLILRVHG